MNKELFTDCIFLIFLGVASSLSLPPFNYFIINFLTFTLFFIFLIKKSNNKKDIRYFFLYGWLFGFGYFASNLYWISISLTFDQSFKYLIPLTVVIIPACLGVFYGFITFFFIILKSKTIISSFITFSLIFGIIEFIRGTILTGFPWNLIAYSFLNHIEVLSITSIIGTYGFNLFCISLFTSPAIFILRKSKKDISMSILFLVIPFFFYIYGLSYKEKFNVLDKISFDFKIRVIGSNISLDRFYSNLDSVSVIEDLIELSNPVKNDKIIFIWPEGILPDVSQAEFVNYNWLFKEKFNNNHLLIVGINNQRINDGFKKYYNSMSIYDNDLNLLNFYNKVNLVPFGEFIPFENILSRIGLKTITNNYQSFSKGEVRKVINLNQENFNLKILPLICYEIIYSGKIFDNNNFDLIVNISEDGWFGNSIGPKQHFAHSIFRAIESGKYIVRSANNGIAAIINPVGIVEQKVDYGQSGYVDFIESRDIKATIFSKFGNKIFVILILLYIFLIFSFNRISNE